MQPCGLLCGFRLLLFDGFTLPTSSHIEIVRRAAALSKTGSNPSCNELQSAYTVMRFSFPWWKIRAVISFRAIFEAVLRLGLQVLRRSRSGEGSVVMISANARFRSSYDNGETIRSVLPGTTTASLVSVACLDTLHDVIIGPTGQPRSCLSDFDSYLLDPADANSIQAGESYGR
jgi:hypothetical protein